MNHPSDHPNYTLMTLKPCSRASVNILHFFILVANFSSSLLCRCNHSSSTNFKCSFSFLCNPARNASCCLHFHARISSLDCGWNETFLGERLSNGDVNAATLGEIFSSFSRSICCGDCAWVVSDSGGCGTSTNRIVSIFCGDVRDWSIWLFKSFRMKTFRLSIDCSTVSRPVEILFTFAWSLVGSRLLHACSSVECSLASHWRFSDSKYLRPPLDSSSLTRCCWWKRNGWGSWVSLDGSWYLRVKLYFNVGRCSSSIKVMVLLVE